MKRKLTVLLVSILTFVMALSLAACNGLPIPAPGTDPVNPDKPAKVEPDARYQTDTRTDAYTAYKSDGTEIGKFKTIAAAINAAVATDDFGSDNTIRQMGSYVENNGVTVFQNQNGFTESNNDQFWFYVNGTQLEGYDCYDGAMYADYLKNNKVITHNVTGFGSAVRQYHNGYALYNPDGTLNEGGEAAQSWELSSTMDAAVLGMPARLKGATGLNYEIDLTNVQIKPNYEGTDDTYAFIGYYAWQDYYVIATGIACNVATGAWYPFEGSSRDDSFSDVTYNIGDSPLMISTWDEEGEYWVPEYTTLKTSIKTVGKSDELGEYYVSESKYEFYTAEGELDNEYTVIIDEEKVGNYFANTAFDANTTYAFIAGLDIRTPTSVSVFSYNTDYTNGAEFKNLTVVNATVHIPSAEELPDTDYGMLINPDWRGNDYNIVMASGEHEEGVYDYNILNTYACASYAQENGKDVYTFSYANDNASTEALGGKAAEYQAKIDKLGDATEETIVGMEDLINEVAAMYGTDFTSATSTIAQKYYLVLDFSPLKYAQDLFAKVATLSDDAKAYVEAFNELPSLLSYEYVGWSTTEEEDAGYLMNDVADFTALYNQYYSKLTETDVQSIKYHVNSTDNYNMYVDLMKKADGYFTPGFKFMAKAQASDAVQSEFTGEQAYADIALYLNKILKATAWGEDPVADNDDPNNARATFLNSDNNWLPSYHVLFLKARLEDAGYELPLYLSNLLTVCGEEEGFTEDWKYLDTVLTLAAGIEKGSIAIVNDEVAAMVNSVMVGKEKFKEGGLNWNFSASGSELGGRSKAYKAYYGLDTGTPLTTYIKSVQDFLVARVGAEVDGVLSIKAEVAAQQVQVSQEAQAVMNLFTTTNIYGSAFDAYDAAMAEYKKLSAEDQAIVAQLSAFNDVVEMIERNKNSLAAVDLTDVDPISVYKTIYYNGDTEIVEMSAKDALYQLNDLLSRMEAQVTFSYENGETDNATQDSVYPTMNFDNVAFPSIRIVVLRQYFEAAGVKLPTYFNEIYTKIAYDTFYQSYDSIYQTVRLAATYAQEGKTVADMTEEDKAIFEKYWGPDYPLDKDALLQWNWNKGNKFETYFSTRVAGIALQYYLASGKTLEERFVVPKTVKWIYGDLMAEYEYKGVKYLAHVYKDEAEALDRTYGALMKGYWEADLLYVDADGNLCSADTEGAKLLTTETEGVTKTEKANWQENCAGDETKVYQTADGQLVYKPRVWRPAESGGAYINYDAPGFVDACNRPVDLTGEELAKVTLVGVVKVYKFYDEFANWLGKQGYAIKANGWGYVAYSEELAEVINLFNGEFYGYSFEEFAVAQAKFNALSEENKALVRQYTNYDAIAELVDGNKNALEAVELEGVKDVTVFSSIIYDGNTATTTMTAKDALYQLNELMYKIKDQKLVNGVNADTAVDTSAMLFDKTAYASVRIHVLMQYFKANNVTVPAYFNTVLESIGYASFVDAYDSIYQTVRLATTYAQEGKTVADMTEEDKAIFEKYWGPSYTLNGDLNWNWNSGHKFEDYYSQRVAAVALQYGLETSTTFEEKFLQPKTVEWIYGDLMAEYEYKGVKYLAHVYKDEADALNRTYGALMKGYWDAALLYVDADGNLCSAGTEGAKLLTTETEGVTKTEKADWQENCAGNATKVYQTADGKLVYKPYVWTPDGTYIDYEAEGFVDACNRPVELSAEELAKVTVVGTVKVYKFYDVLGTWLEAQGYTVKTNGWGYQQAPTAE